MIDKTVDLPVGKVWEKNRFPYSCLWEMRLLPHLSQITIIDVHNQTDCKNGVILGVYYRNDFADPRNAFG